MSGREEIKEQMVVLEEIVEQNPCQMPDYVMRAIALGAKFVMHRYVMNKQQVADYFGVSIKTIDRWRDKHGFPCEDSNGNKAVSICVDKMLEWKRSHEDVWGCK